MSFESLVVQYYESLYLPPVVIEYVTEWSTGLGTLEILRGSIHFIISVLFNFNLSFYHSKKDKQIVSSLAYM